MRYIINLYINSFKGLRKEVWWLAFITFINRSGTMVIPFLSLYLTTDMSFSKEQVGWIMSAFGLGSLIGAWIGGKLTDKLGYYPVMFITLTLSGIMFIGLQFIKSFEGFMAGIFLLMVIADGFRPAMYVAIGTYSKPENRTRSVTLIRLAINLGFSAGPAIGGLIIASLTYSGLFWVDGVTCLSAAILFISLLKYKKASVPVSASTDVPNKINRVSAYRDKSYLIFLLAAVLIGFGFMQLFSTVPLFYKEVHQLSEVNIGLLMAGNGLIIFILEMPLMKYLEHPRFSIYKILSIGTLLILGSFLILNTGKWAGILVISMLLITFGEMLNFPFLNRFALDRAEKGRTGEYMALFSMTFSASQVFSHKVVMNIIEGFGYKITWYFIAVVLIIATLLFSLLRIRVTKENKM